MTHTLPPLNPMSTAPRDGTRIIVMTKRGEIVGVTSQHQNKWELPVLSVSEWMHP